MYIYRNSSPAAVSYFSSLHFWCRLQASPTLWRAWLPLRGNALVRQAPRVPLAARAAGPPVAAAVEAAQGQPTEQA